MTNIDLVGIGELAEIGMMERHSYLAVTEGPRQSITSLLYLQEIVCVMNHNMNLKRCKYSEVSAC